MNIKRTSSGCQPKTFKTFILMVKPLETFIFLRKTFRNLYFSQKNLYFQEKLGFFQYSGCQDPIKSYIFSNVLFCPIF